jgi:hypothetical protein
MWTVIGIITVLIVVGVCVYFKFNPILIAFEIIGDVIGDFFD